MNRASEKHEKAALAYAAQHAVVERKTKTKEAFERALDRYPPGAPLMVLGQSIPLTDEIRTVLKNSVDHDLFLEMEKRSDLSRDLAAAERGG